MFFLISKTLDLFFNPITWVFALMLAAFFSGEKRKMKQILLWALIVFYLFGNSFLVDEVMRKWEIKPDTKELRKGSYEYGIVLGGVMSGYVYKNEQLIFNRSVDRLMQAIMLYRQGVIKKIVFTGGSGSVIETEMKEGKFIKDYLILIGIPDSVLVFENESRNTYENAVFTKKIIGVDKDRTDLLITSGSHMRRSLAIFRKQGFTVIPYSADLRSGNRKFDPEHLFMPSYGALDEWNVIIHEWVGMIAYKINGYL